MKQSVIWVDIPVRDLDRAVAFYTAVLGAPVTRQGGPGFSFGLLPHEGNGAGGCLVVPEAGENAPSLYGPLVYLNATGRLAQAVLAVAEHGGQVLQGVHTVGPHGFRALVLDSEGNRLALHAPAV